MPTSKPLPAHTDKVYQLLQVDDMTGGVDLRSAPTQIGPTRAERLVNYSIREPGVLQVRKGYTRFSTGSLSTIRGQGGQRVYLSSHTFTLFAHDGEVHLVTASGGWDSSGSTNSVYSTIASTSEVFFPYDRDLVAIFDGATNAIRKSTNGSSWTRFGIAAPSTDSTLASASSGNLLAQEFEIGFTYEDTNLSHESNGGATSTITLGSTGAINVEVHGSTDVQVGQVRFYARNKTAGETVRRLASSAANQTDGSTLSVVITSSGWTGNDEEPTDHDLPPALAFGVVWKNRWWAVHGTRKNRLHFTQIFQPQSWPASFFIDIPFTRGDEIKAIATQGDTMIICGHTTIFVVIGQTSLDFEVRPAINAQGGAVGPRAIEAIENGIVHADVTGVYIFDGTSDRLLSFEIEDAWRDLMRNASTADIERIALEYHALEKELRIAVPRLFPQTTSGEWVLDLARTRLDEVPAWTATDRGIGGYIHFDGAESTAADRGRLQSWNDTSGLLFEESTGTAANSSNMVAEYDGPTFAMGLTRAQFPDIRGEYEPNDGVFTVDVVVDQVAQGTITPSIGAGLARYGTALYGTGTYGGSGRRMYAEPLPMSAEGRNIQLRHKYVGQQAFRTFTYAFGLLPEPRPRLIGD